MGKKFSLSIAICSRNRPKDLIDILKCLKKQSLQPDEYIIIENINEFKYFNLQKISKILNSHSIINYFPVTYKTISVSRNLALDQCHTSILLFIDDDVLINDDLIQKITALHQKHQQALGFVGKVLPTDRSTLSLIDSYFALNQKLHTTKLEHQLNFASSSTVSLNMNVVRKFKLRFYEQLKTGEDMDFFIKAKQTNHPLIFSPKIVTKHKFNRKNQIQKYYFYGQDHTRLSVLHPLYFNYLWCFPSRKINFILFPFFWLSTLLRLTFIFCKENKLPTKAKPLVLLVYIYYLLGLYSSSETQPIIKRNFIKSFSLKSNN